VDRNAIPATTATTTTSTTSSSSKTTAMWGRVGGGGGDDKAMSASDREKAAVHIDRIMESLGPGKVACRKKRDGPDESLCCAALRLCYACL
jgi:hypothetical protein